MRSSSPAFADSLPVSSPTAETAVSARPALVFLPGYMSDMAGSKATYLQAWAQETGRECLLLDYSGCGESPGDFADGSLSTWCDEVVSVITARLSGPVVLIGSSMGGWLMLMVARRLGDQVTGLVGIAAAPDFTDWGYNAEEQAQLAAGKTLLRHNPYGPDATPTHPLFWQDGQNNRQLTAPIPITCPVRLLHGTADAEVPSALALQLAENLRSTDVQVVLVKQGDHRLSRPQDLLLLQRTVESLA